jgi:hypothetical protein
MLLSNPEYVKELQNKQSEGDMLYENAYKNYKDNKYNEALQLIAEGVAKYKGTELAPKLRLLQALCLGKTSDIRTFRASLDKLSKDYPHNRRRPSCTRHDRIPEPTRTTNCVWTKRCCVAENESATDSNTPITYSKPEGEQFFALLVPKKSNINQLKFNIVSFNVIISSKQT